MAAAMINRLIAPITLLAITFSVPIAQAAPKSPDIRLIASPPESSDFSIALGQQLIRAIYQQCGLTVEFLEAPPARSVTLAETGWADGELARPAHSVNPDSELVPLEPPISRLQLVPIYLDPAIPHEHSLDAADRIGYINGYRLAPQLLPSGKQGLAAHSTDQLLRLLEMGRIDAGVTLGWDAQRAAAVNPKLMIGAPILDSPVYHYIHNSRLKDAPCLSLALQGLKDSGYVDRLNNEAISAPQQPSTEVLVTSDPAEPLK